MTSTKCTRSVVVSSAMALLLLASSCDDPSSASHKTAATPEELFPDGCDPISPDFCGAPFPSNVWTVPDPSTPTGLRVHPHDTKPQPQRADDSYLDLSVLRWSDGFSANGDLIAFFPNVALEGTAPVTDPAASLAPDSKTVLIDAETGEHIPHWVELDMRAADDTARDLLIRPAVKLEDATRYIVAIRGLVDTNGTTLAPSPAFRALRDGKSFDHPSIAGRRALYADLFARLEGAGVPRRDLQLAWDFTTASGENNTSHLLRIRELAQAALGGQPASLAITRIDDDVDANIARRIEGTAHVPLFLDASGAGGHLVLDENGMPTQTGWADFPFVVQIPRSAVSGTGTATPKPVLQYGHGLYLDRYEGDQPRFRSFANTYGYVLLTVDWLGYTGDDVAVLGALAVAGDLGGFETQVARALQAMSNQDLILDAVLRTLPSDARTMVNAGQATISPAEPRYMGQSLGGQFGSVYLALSSRVKRGVLLVPGQSFSLVGPRSHTYTTLEIVLTGTFYDQRRLPLVLDILQMLVDRVEGAAFVPYLRSGDLPGAIPHEALVMNAIGDQTVTTLASELLARTMGIPLVGPPVRPVFGLEEVPSPHTGSGLVEFDFGPPEPLINVPSDAPGDPHIYLSAETSPIPRQMAAEFLETGVISNLCSGTCDPF